MKKEEILIVEDDAVVASLVAEVLAEAGFAASIAETAYHARAHLGKAPPLLVILDRRLPDADGLQLCEEMRQKPALADIPVLFLTAKGSTSDKIEGLKRGGDDYLAKPFSPKELLARVEAILRRSGRGGMPAALEAEGLRLDTVARKAFLGGKEVALTPKQFDLMAVLIANKNRALTREFLLQQVWGYEDASALATRVVDVTFSHLRGKLGAWSRRIASVRGRGYRLDCA